MPYNLDMKLELDPDAVCRTDPPQGWKAVTLMARVLADQLTPHTVRERRVFDFGCGHGLLALLCVRNGARLVYAVDSDERALGAVARNAEANGLECPRLASFLDMSLPQPGDLVVASGVHYHDNYVTLESVWPELTARGVGVLVCECPDNLRRDLWPGLIELHRHTLGRKPVVVYTNELHGWTAPVEPLG